MSGRCADAAGGARIDSVDAQGGETAVSSATVAGLPAGIGAGWTAIRESIWAYPALEVVHLAGVALLLGNLLLFELRLIGLGAGVDRRSLAGLALPVAVAGFSLAAASGLLMFASQPAELLVNPAFRLKIGLLLLAGLNALAFHLRGGSQREDAIARGQGLLSLALWLTVLACGRWIAYV